MKIQGMRDTMTFGEFGHPSVVRSSAYAQDYDDAGSSLGSSSGGEEKGARGESLRDGGGEFVEMEVSAQSDDGAGAGGPLSSTVPYAHPPPPPPPTPQEIDQWDSVPAPVGVALYAESVSSSNTTSVNSSRPSWKSNRSGPPSFNPSAMISVASEVLPSAASLGYVRGHPPVPTAMSYTSLQDHAIEQARMGDGQQQSRYRHPALPRFRGNSDKIEEIPGVKIVMAQGACERSAREACTERRSGVR
jgi:hypothetical protein